MKIGILNAKILTGKFSGRCMSDNWCDNSKYGTEFHDTNRLIILLVDLNKPRKDYNFPGNLSHSYIQIYPQMSPFYDAVSSKVTEWNHPVDLLRCTHGMTMLDNRSITSLLYYYGILIMPYWKKVFQNNFFGVSGQ